MKKYAIWHLFMAESPKFLHLIGNWGRETRVEGDVRFLTESRTMSVSRMRKEKIRNLALIYGPIAKIPESSLTEIYHGLPMEKSWNSMEKTWTPCKNHGFSMSILNMGRIHGAYCLDYMGCPRIFHGFSMERL